MPEITVTASLRIGESQITITRTGSQAPADPSKLGAYAGEIIQQAIDPLLAVERAKAAALEAKVAELSAPKQSAKEQIVSDIHSAFGSKRRQPKATE